MSDINVAVLRKLCWHYISPTTCDAAELTMHELKQFIAGNYTPSERANSARQSHWIAEEESIR